MVLTTNSHNQNHYQMYSYSTMLSVDIDNQLTQPKPLSDVFIFYNAVCWYWRPTHTTKTTIRCIHILQCCLLILTTNSHNQNHYQMYSYSTMLSDGIDNQLTQPKPLSDVFIFYNAVCWYWQPTHTTKTTIRCIHILQCCLLILTTNSHNQNHYQMYSYSTMLSVDIDDQLTQPKPLSDVFIFYNAVCWYSQPTHTNKTAIKCIHILQCCLMVFTTNSHNQNHYKMYSYSTMLSVDIHNQLTLTKPLSDVFTFYNAVCWYRQPTHTTKTTIRCIHIHNAVCWYSQPSNTNKTTIRCIHILQCCLLILTTNSHNQNHYQMYSYSTMLSVDIHNQLTLTKPLSDVSTFYNAVCWYSRPTHTNKTTIRCIHILQCCLMVFTTNSH